MNTSQKTNHKHTHSCECSHEDVKYCKICKVCHCLGCNQEWPAKTTYWGNYWPYYSNTISSGGLRSYNTGSAGGGSGLTGQDPNTLYKQAQTSNNLNTLNDGHETLCKHSG